MFWDEGVIFWYLIVLVIVNFINDLWIFGCGGLRIGSWVYIVMEDEVCGRGKRVKRVIVCCNGWYNCCLFVFEKINFCFIIFKLSLSICKVVFVVFVYEVFKDVL